MYKQYVEENINTIIE